MEPIVRRHYPEPDRSEAQERIARAVETDPEPFLARYRAHPQSFGGRYVCSDLFKETFPEFRASNEARGRFNNPLHNPAAVLAAEQFRRRLEDATRPEQDTVIFLTGVPGAGKTTAVLDHDEMDPNVRVIYEGQLARPGNVLPKVQQALDAGLKVAIIAVHLSPEAALLNTLNRFTREGRGASIEAMASIQGGLPDGLGAIYERFGDRVEFQLFDRRGGPRSLVEREGWEHLPELRSEGTYEHLKARLHAALDGHELVGVFGPDAIAHARGLAPRARDQELHPWDGREHPQPPARNPEGPEQRVATGGTGPSATTLAAGEAAEARGIEADQARLQSQGQNPSSSAGENYDSALRTYLQSNAERIERIESRLKTLVENQEAALSELNAHPPGFFASRQTRAEWAASVEHAQDRLQILSGRLDRVEDLEKRTEELAEEQLRRREPELAEARDAQKRAGRALQEQQRRARSPEREVGRDHERVLGLGLGADYPEAAMMVDLARWSGPEGI